ncbi:MAG TPA: hypothetical protein VGL56_06005 [Fimbriimonadaceae bacterium]|jgi:hypothetical protein
MPTAEGLLRQINLERYSFADRLETSIRPSRRAFVNEGAFRILAEHVFTASPASNRIDKVFVARPSDLKQEFMRSKIRREFFIGGAEFLEGCELAARLGRFFYDNYKLCSFQFSPEFDGCGILDKAKGDLMIEDILFEVKSGDRDFRLIDLRQLITYCALDFASEKRKIKKVGLVNPRVGIWNAMDIESFCKGAGGNSSSDLLSDIVYFLSTETAPY